ncbi:MAG: hypothetical protein KUG71_02975, partial [Porticoccaceae bacterium]|nr:hypothetical protein [Porticoccaceae bacterium]
LLAAFAAQSSTVTRKHVRIAKDDSQVDSSARKTINHYFGGLSFVAIAGFVVWVYYSNAVGREDIKLHELQPSIKMIEAPILSELSPEMRSIIKKQGQSGLTEADIEVAVKESTAEGLTLKEERNEIVGSGTNALATLLYGLDNDQTPLLNDLVKKTMLWANGATKSGYTIQIMTSYTNDTTKLEEFFRRFDRSTFENEIYVYPFAHGEHIAHTVTFGEVGDYQSAVQLLQTLPDMLKRYKPFIRTLSSLRQYPGLVIDKRDS